MSGFTDERERERKDMGRKEVRKGNIHRWDKEGMGANSWSPVEIRLYLLLRPGTLCSASQAPASAVLAQFTHKNTHAQARGEKAFRVKVHSACAYVLCYLLQLFSGTRKHTAPHGVTASPAQLLKLQRESALSPFHIPLSDRLGRIG